MLKQFKVMNTHVNKLTIWQFSFKYCCRIIGKLYTYEPSHEKTCLMSYANNKGADDQTAHQRSLISAFVVRCLDGIISLDSIPEISRL